MPRISIIVPVYKTEQYISRCIDSILAQTFTDWELLLIDDGSPDKSGDICEMYGRKDGRIKVFHKENGGVSSARQKGQDEAQGEYTIHVDSDDWVEPDMLENLYAKIKEEDADMVICDYFENKGSRQKYVEQQPSKLDVNTVLYELFQQLHGSCCNKLVKQVCYKGKVEFPQGINCCEDLIWCVQTIQQCKKITYLPKAYYHYMINDKESQSKIVSREQYEQDKRMLRQLETLLKENETVLNAMRKKNIAYVMKRAMRTPGVGGEEIKLFFKPYRKYLWSNTTISCPLKFVCLMASYGFYEICRPLINRMK